MEFLDWDAGQLTEALREGRLQATEVMAATLARIAAKNGAVNAIVGMQSADVLMAEARAADAVAVSERGKLHGLPMAVKDLSDVRGLTNSEGSPLYASRVSEADSRFVGLLRDAGAIFIGKTNVPEFGLGSHTYNPVYGATLNPFDPSRTAGGSSGGAAVAVATGMVALADGSDMMGSLRNPAAWNNVYGFRPSWGVVPRTPDGDSFWYQLSSVGPLARSPRDLALLLEVIAVPDARVPFNMPTQSWELPDSCSMQGARIGWLGDWGGALPMEDGILAQCQSGLEVMRALGAEVVDVAPPFDAEEMYQAWSDLRSFGLAGEMAETYADTEKRARLKEEVVWEIERGLAMSAAQLHAASQTRAAWFARAAELFADFDALVLPVTQCWPFPVDWDWPKEIDGQVMDNYQRWMQVMVPVSLIGVPAISLPVGFGGAGLPMGMQMFGPKCSDLRVLEMAQAYHEATRWPQKSPPSGLEA